LETLDPACQELFERNLHITVVPFLGHTPLAPFFGAENVEIIWAKEMFSHLSLGGKE